MLSEYKIRSDPFGMEGGALAGAPIKAQRKFSGHIRPIIERDEGQFQIGIGDDASGPFESRQSALQVACGHQPTPAVSRSEFGRRAMRGPPDPEMRNRPAANGTAYRKEPINTPKDNETHAKAQLQSPRIRFALAYYVAATAARLVFGLAPR